MSAPGAAEIATIQADMRGIFARTVTIQVATVVRDEYGEPDQTAWANVSGLVALPCAIAPVGSREQRNLPITFSEATHVITLSDGYPAIVPHNRAVDDSGTVYDISGPPLIDTYGIGTRLPCRIVTVST